jgi:hypothetical protein
MSHRALTLPALKKEVAMNRFAIACLSLLAFGWVLVVRADDPVKPDDSTKPKDDKSSAAIKEESRENQQMLERRFKDFEQSLLRLAQRLEKSSKPEDRQRAETLKKAIALVGDQGVDLKFKTLIEILQKPSTSLSLTEIKEAMDQNKMLAEDIRAILALLMADNRDDQLKNEIKRLMELIKQLDKVIREQKIARAKTEGNKLDKEALGKEQKKVSDDTEKIAKAMNKDGDGKGDSKGKGEPKDGKDGKGQGGQGQGQQGDKNKDKPKDNPPQDNPNQPPDGSPGKKQVQDANQYQRQAEDQIKKEDKDDASKKQSQAIAKLEEARRKLEEILRQLREEEIERLLAKLEQRCRFMLQIQIEVYDGTVRVDKAIGTNPDKKASRAEEQRALQLSDREEVIVVEANKAIQILEAEGTAVAFPQMFEQVRDDAKNVARRLGKADVGTVTQVIEQDIIAALKDMIEALKKAQQDLKSQGQGQPGQPQNQKLIDLLAELKMIRAMQVRVNSRTKVYGQKYTGEQAGEPDIQKELEELAQRQLKIFDVTNNIAKGKNQ